MLRRGPEGFQRCDGFFIDVRKSPGARLSFASCATNFRRVMSDENPTGPAFQRFVLKADAEREIAFDGAPVCELPEWGGVARADGLRFILHPPLDFEIAYQIPDYLIFAPYSRAVVDVSVKDGPSRRKAWAAGSAFVVPPEICVRAKMAEPVEFLCVVVSADRAESAFERAARGRAWAPQLIEEFVDAGFATLQQEVRRTLLGDPLIEPSYLEGLGDAMLARIGCRLAGTAVGTQTREAISPGVLRRLVQHIEENLGDKLVVEELAEASGLSRSHFSRAFLSATGEPPQEFIIGRRICRARDLLANGDRPIAEIAAVTGFSSQAHLSMAFKKRLGLTPARYRASFGR